MATTEPPQYIKPAVWAENFQIQAKSEQCTQTQKQKSKPSIFHVQRNEEKRRNRTENSVVHHTWGVKACLVRLCGEIWKGKDVWENDGYGRREERSKKEREEKESENGYGEVGGARKGRPYARADCTGDLVTPVAAGGRRWSPHGLPISRLSEHHFLLCGLQPLGFLVLFGANWAPKSLEILG